MFKGYIFSENNNLNEKAIEKVNEYFSKILDTKIGNHLTDYQFDDNQENELYIYHNNTEQPVFSICLGSVEDNTKPYYNVEDGSVEEFEDVQALFDGLTNNFDDIMSEISDCVDYINDDEYDDEDEEYDDEW